MPERIARLAPQVKRLDADILCLQEVNAQTSDGQGPRRFVALDALLAGTRYEHYKRAATTSPGGDPADIHNLVILSRYPITARRQYHHDYVAPPTYRPATAIPPAREFQPVEWERPVLHVEIAIGAKTPLHVFNLHLRAPIAAPITGQKLAPLVWKTVGGWAEGFYLAAIKRTGQALEARLAIERIFDAEPDALIAVAGDFNADAREMPVRVLRGDAEDTGNDALAFRALSALERAVAAERRYSVLHHGEALMLDHLLVSPALLGLNVRAEIHNEGLADEYLEGRSGAPPAGSFHAPVVAEFEIPERTVG